MKPVFVIMVTYRRFGQFKATMDSLLPTLPGGSVVAVVYNRDDARHEDDDKYQEFFMASPANVHVLDTGSNDGWGASMNEGLHLYSQWKGFEYVLESNNDVTYEPDWCAKAQEIMRVWHEIGILGLISHPYHGVRRRMPDGTLIKDDMPATAWFMRSKDLEQFLPFPEHGACKTRGGNGEDVAFRDKVQNKLGRWIAAPRSDLAHHMDGYDIPDLGKPNPAYE